LKDARTQRTVSPKTRIATDNGGGGQRGAAHAARWHEAPPDASFAARGALWRAPAAGRLACRRRAPHGSTAVAGGRVWRRSCCCWRWRRAGAYRPVLDASFFDLDDNVVVTENPHIRALSWETARWAATTDLAGYAIPSPGYRTR
jgi:hypothetical protein